MTVDSPLRDLLAHPAFAGFVPLLLPWDNRTYDPNMPLHDLGSLLPYHSHVDPATSVKALNRMVDDIGQGKVVFYDFYSEAQKREQPARRYTGLFFFRGKPGASALDAKRKPPMRFGRWTSRAGGMGPTWRKSSR